MFLEETSAASENLDPLKQGTPMDGKTFIEPDTCPYPVPDLTTKAAQSARSAATKTNTFDSSIEKGSMGVGKPANGIVQAPSNTAANDEKLYGIDPIASEVELSVTISAFASGLNFALTICS